MSDDPLEQLAAAEPLVPAPSDAATARARADLLAHIARNTERSSPTRRAAPTRQQTANGGARRSRVGVVAAAVVVTIAAALGVVYLDRPQNAEVVVAAPPDALGPELVDATDVEGFIARVIEQGDPLGDATIVLRVHGGDQGERRGVDVFADDGRYGYGQSADAALGQLADGAATRPWPVSQEVTLALADVAAEGPDGSSGAPERFVAAMDLPTPQGDPLDETEIRDEAWSGVVASLPMLPGSVDATAGAIRVVDGLAGVELRNAVLDGREVVVAVRSVASAEERIFFDAATGVPIRFDRVSSGGELLAEVSYRIDRVELD